MNENEKSINKPITVVRYEFIENLANVINSSGLPAFVIAPILSDFLEETKIVAKKQYELDKDYYEKLVSAKDNDNNGE